MDGKNAVESGGYSSLKDLKLEIIGNKDGFNIGFALCFWLYLPADSASRFPSTILYQQNSCGNVQFLAMTEDIEMVFYLNQEVPDLNDATPDPGMETRRVKTKNEVPLDKWVHIGCEVSTNIARLYINGETMGEMRVTCTPESLKKIYLVGANEGDSIEGHVYGVEILSVMSSIKGYFVKNPPFQLHVDGLSAPNMKEDSGGVWVVIGGKPSIRRNLSADVVLKDAFGHMVNKEMEVVAALAYANDGAHIEKPYAMLLTIYNGIEFASWDRPSKLVNGRASFKLKISQLSSKCENRLFLIKFSVPKMEKRYHFLEGFTSSILSISRNHNARQSTLIRKQPTVEPENSSVHAAKPTPTSKKRTKDDKQKGKALTLEARQKTHKQTHDSDGGEATNSSKSMASNTSQVSNQTVFKYSLGSLTEKSFLLKDLVNSSSDEDIMDFAMQVYQLFGSVHHWNQIRISKRMIEDGLKIWILLSQNNRRVFWNNMIPVLHEQFIKISCCPNRILTMEDFEVLKRIGGCDDLVGQENFEKIWYWLYPVAFSLSQNMLKEIWDSRWIEGFVTKEEAVSSLIRPGNNPAGTFILRFPTSRSWPHPDAGNLIASYVGTDLAVHHKLLSIDFFHSSGKKSLKEMLLEERELSQLGRITSRDLLVV